jgi:hypothetical protein
VERGKGPPARARSSPGARALAPSARPRRARATPSPARQATLHAAQLSDRVPGREGGRCGSNVARGAAATGRQSGQAGSAARRGTAPHPAPPRPSCNTATSDTRHLHKQQRAGGALPPPRPPPRACRPPMRRGASAECTRAAAERRQPRRNRCAPGAEGRGYALRCIGRVPAQWGRAACTPPPASIAAGEGCGGRAGGRVGGEKRVSVLRAPPGDWRPGGALRRARPRGQLDGAPACSTGGGPGGEGPAARSFWGGLGGSRKPGHCFVGGCACGGREEGGGRRGRGADARGHGGRRAACRARERRPPRAGWRAGRAPREWQARAAWLRGRALGRRWGGVSFFEGG